MREALIQWPRGSRQIMWLNIIKFINPMTMKATLYPLPANKYLDCSQNSAESRHLQLIKILNKVIHTILATLENTSSSMSNDDSSSLFSADESSKASHRIQIEARIVWFLWKVSSLKLGNCDYRLMIRTSTMYVKFLRTNLCCQNLKL